MLDSVFVPCWFASFFFQLRCVGSSGAFRHASYRTMDAFGHESAPARSSSPNSSLHATSRFKDIFRRTKSNRPQRWKSPVLHPTTLTIAIITPLLLALTLVLLLKRSQREHGIIFSQDINALPLSRSFL
ncbi:hypothetical protein PMIN03_000933 [Paraphaeosphaeria minitans]